MVASNSVLTNKSSVHLNTQETAKRKNTGSIRASAAAIAASTVSTPISLGIASQIPKFSKNLTKDQVEIINKAADNVLNNVTNLSKKGVTIMDCKPIGASISKFYNKILELTNPTFSAGVGKNAFFIPKTKGNPYANTVLVNREKLPVATFHEMGHAFNSNNSKFWKAMQGLRNPAMRLGVVFMLLPALTKEEVAEPNKELTKGQKFKNGLRKASPLLAGLSMVPTLAEEGMASIRGGKWARSLLDKNLAKKVTKFNLTGFSTYLITAGLMVLGSYVGKHVKDKAMEKKYGK